MDKGKNLEIMPILTALKREGRKVDLEPGVNLRYALRYSEKRPFFMEGMEIFKYPEIEMVYTRRIIDPAFGAKLSGKTGRFAYSVLSSYDLHPSESLWDVQEKQGHVPNGRFLFCDAANSRSG